MLVCFLEGQADMCDVAVKPISVVYTDAYLLRSSKTAYCYACFIESSLC